MLNTVAFALASTVTASINATPAHFAESSVPTPADLRVADDWISAVTANKHSATFIDEWLGCDLPFSFRYDGNEANAMLGKWKRTEAKSVQNNAESKVVVWNDPQTGLEIKWEIKRFKDYPAVEWVLRFKNTGTKDTPIIEAIKALRLRLNQFAEGEFTVYGANGGRSLPDDLAPITWYNRTDKETDSWLLGDDYSSNKHLPFWNMATPDGRGIAVGLGWTGQWLANFEVNNRQMMVQAGVKECSFYLKPGEEIRSPSILLVFWNGKPMHGQNMLRQVLYKHFIHPVKGKPQKPMVTVNTCFTHHGLGGFLTQCKENNVLPLIEPFAKIGAEALIIDAGWYRSGDKWTDFSSRYEISEERYPNGFKQIAQSLSKHDMKFGLWFGVEHIGHPSDPSNSDRMLERVDYMVKNQGMTMYRQDGFIHYAPGDTGRIGLNEISNVTSIYRIWDEIIHRHPDLVMEGCADGGRKIDMETIQRFSWFQKSDRWFNSNSDQCAVYGGSSFLPGGYLNLPTQSTDNYTAWSSFGGQLCLGWHPLDTDFPMEQACKQVALYKRIRNLLCGDFYPITECSIDAPWMAYQFNRVDLDRGVAMIYKRNDSEGESFNLKLKGLDPKSLYHLDFEGSKQSATYRGDVLAKGVLVRVSGTPGAELVIYQKAGNK